ncbi:hypothetical protein ARMGADRAFT_620464 [Armillaria gallica]|uniref:Uncharacterized protein n=1 Tax=Armillaria gallica TaxID=47427 RepID=A0A2H3CL95_ARMGA|nr:hypothetical protein ARMGADRAFT_620464 [Armillaria gallica]
MPSHSFSIPSPDSRATSTPATGTHHPRESYQYCPGWMYWRGGRIWWTEFCGQRGRQQGVCSAREAEWMGKVEFCRDATYRRPASEEVVYAEYMYGGGTDGCERGMRALRRAPTMTGRPRKDRPSPFPAIHLPLPLTSCSTTPSAIDKPSSLVSTS